MSRGKGVLIWKVRDRICERERGRCVSSEVQNPNVRWFSVPSLTFDGTFDELESSRVPPRKVRRRWRSVNLSHCAPSKLVALPFRRLRGCRRLRGSRRCERHLGFAGVFEKFPPKHLNWERKKEEKVSEGKVKKR